jgi:hypothetical protein
VASQTAKTATANDNGPFHHEGHEATTTATAGFTAAARRTLSGNRQLQTTTATAGLAAKNAKAGQDNDDESQRPVDNPLSAGDGSAAAGPPSAAAADL